MSLLSAQLQAFLAVVRNGTVHGAAGDLRLTQTGVTQRIRAIERDLGVTLFLRSRKGMRLTQEGEALLRYCKGTEELEGEALAQIKNAARDRPIEVMIAGPTSVMTARVVEQCAPLFSEWPKLQLSFVISDSEDRVAMVRSGKATFAIVRSDQVPNEMDSKRLKPNRYVLVGPRAWKGRRMHDLLDTERVIDFGESDPTTLNYLKAFGLLEHLKRPRLFVNNNEAIIRLFARGIGFGTLTQEIARPHLDSGALTLLNGGAAVEESLALAWYPRLEMPPYFRAILDSIK